LHETVLQIPKLIHVLQNHQHEPYGIQYQSIPKHGIEQHGYQQIVQQHIMQQQVQQAVTLNVIHDFSGIQVFVNLNGVEIRQHDIYIKILLELFSIH
jgi:hypothetical protein